MRRLSLWILLLIGGSYCEAKELPSFIQKCQRTASPAERNKCIMARVEDVKPHLIKGIPDMDLPQIEPFRISKLEFHLGSGSNLGMDLSYADVDIYGAKNFEVKELDLNMEENHGSVFLHVYVPDLRARANYRLKGRVLLFQIDASGVTSVNITENHFRINKNFEIVNRDGKEYAKFDDKKDLEVTYATVSLYFDDLISNNKELSEQVNQVINDNYDLIRNEIDSFVQGGVYSVVYETVKTFLEGYSLDELFE